MLSVLISCKSAFALIDTPTLRFSLGYSMVKFGAVGISGQPQFAEGTPIASLVTLNPSFLWDVPVLRSRVGIHFLADIGSPFGFISIIGVGADYVFYPMGLSSSREVKDDGSVIVKTRISPFFEFKLTPLKMSITDPTVQAAGVTSYFNVLMVETSIGAGVDYPLTESMIGIVGLHYRFASFTGESATVGQVKYSGPILLLGISANFY